MALAPFSRSHLFTPHFSFFSVPRMLPLFDIRIAVIGCIVGDSMLTLLM